MFNKKINIILICMLLVFTQLTCPAFAETSGPGAKGTSLFSDVDSSHWAYGAISWMVGQKILSGYPDCTFKPGNIILRSEFAKIMVLAMTFL
jgi:hypothetical protein